jgi:hypothetical protein
LAKLQARDAATGEEADVLQLRTPAALADAVTGITLAALNDACDDLLLLAGQEQTTMVRSALESLTALRKVRDQVRADLETIDLKLTIAERRVTG